MDLGLLREVVKRAGRPRDRLLVLMEVLTGLSYEDLRTLTVREAATLLKQLQGSPFAQAAKVLLLKVRDAGALANGDLLFPSRKKDALLGMLMPIGRIQAWRIMRRALDAVGLTGGGVVSLLRAACRAALTYGSPSPGMTSAHDILLPVEGQAIGSGSGPTRGPRLARLRVLGVP